DAGCACPPACHPRPHRQQKSWTHCTRPTTCRVQVSGTTAGSPGSAAALLAPPPALLQPPHQPRSCLLASPSAFGGVPCAVAGCAGRVWAVADGVWVIPPLAA